MQVTPLKVRIGTLVFLLCLGAQAGARPNVLLVLTDDQGYGDLSLHGNPHLRTPHIDRFAEHSIRFDRFYVHPFCSPTRSALLTGRWPMRSGVWGVTRDQETMRTEEVTLAETLRDAGYRTGCFGKWHNGMQHPYTPRAQGFDEFYGFVGGHWNSYFNPELEHNGKPVTREGYMPDLLTDAAIDFMRRNRDEPFLCYVPYNTPHSPDQLPDRYFDRYKAMGLDDHTAAAYGMCENIDDNFARLLTALDEMKLADDTIVIFLTDNGPNGTRYNAGMRGAKGSVHEGGSRVPMFVRIPGAAPRIIHTLAAHIDLYPTLLDLCGISLPATPPIDGRNLRPLLEGNGTGWPDRTLYTHRGLGAWDRPYPAAVRTDRYRLVREREAWELFDMTQDPGQKRDIAREHPGIVEELVRGYDAWYADVTSTGWSPPPIPVGHQEENPVELRATQARIEGSAHYFASRAGFANDWITGWKETDSKIHFDIDAHEAGSYTITLIYSCPTTEAGARIRLRGPQGELTGTVPPADPRDIPLPTRDQDRIYASRHWARWNLGAMSLQEGRQTLTLEALSLPGGTVMDLKGILLERKK